ncbi:MAG: carbohydrate ABC transporter permease [Candidatus Sumerlaeaceae bacterium]|nr:carbohydrate ABC transporter permease [Candidatus Sumerlaeaceae bacterium]
MTNRDIDLYLRRVNQGGGLVAHRLRLAARYALMLLIAAVMLGPFIWLLYLSLRMDGKVYDWPTSIRVFSLESYSTVLREFPIGTAFKNSVIVAVVTVFLTVIVASLAAYPLARYDFYGRNVVFLGILSTLMVPFQLYLIPLFMLTTNTLHLGNTLTGAVLPFIASVFGIYLIKQFYSSVPRDMEEAARVDGASELRVWWQVMFPLTKPAVATLSIFTFVGSWSSFLWPLIVLGDDQKQTLPVALAMLTGSFVERTSFLAAGSVIAVAPVIVFFLLFQRWFLGGMTIGAVKG